LGIAKKDMALKANNEAKWAKLQVVLDANGLKRPLKSFVVSTSSTKKSQ